MSDYFLLLFESTGVSVQEKKHKMYYQNNLYGRFLWCPLGTILAVFDLQIALILPKKFKSVSLSAQEKKLKMDVQDGSYDGHFVILIHTILASFDLQVVQMLPTRFRDN